MEHHAHTHHDHDFDWAAMVAFAELEAEVLMSFLAEATSLLAGLCERDGLQVRRILDIGSGPGVGTCALAERSPSAAVVAADGSTEMLDNVASRAARLGLSERVTTRLVELPGGLDGLGRADVVWASMVLHHVGDVAATLSGVRSLLEPGGLLALAEFGDPLRVVPDDADLDRPGLWARLDAAGAAWLADMRAGLPGATESGDYPTMLEAAGFEVLTDRVITVQLDAPLNARARRVALCHLELMNEHVEPFAGPDDVAAMAALTDEESPDGIMRRPDALLRVSRHLFVARAVPTQ